MAEAYQVGFGNRRLSILDLSEAGRMPMNLAGTHLWITFNGEIYNYLELRSELSAGRRFSTGTDTEVLLAAYEKWGPDCLTRLNGMFAFGIWDGVRKRLFLARDRLGEKPLYFAYAEGQFMFGSELKQFMADEHFSHRIDLSALADFVLHSVHDHDDRTFLADAKQLLPAHWVELDVLTGKLEGPFCYWAPEIADDLDATHDAEFEERLRFLLTDAVRLRLRSDVNVGVCLSGGLDSTALCATMASQSSDPTNLTAYTVTFPGYPEDEALVATQCANRAGVRHIRVTFEPSDLWDGIHEMLYFHDDPSGIGGSTFASWRIFQAARTDGTVVLLNGQGGDELFAGYDKFFFFWFEILFSHGRLLHLVSSATSYLKENGLDRWHLANARRYFPNALRKRLPGIWQLARPEFRRLAAGQPEIGSGDSLNRRLWKDLSRFSLRSLLHWEDRNSMAAGTEVRLPLLDHRIAEAVLSTSVHTKLNRGFTKYALRSTMRPLLPPEVCWQRRKRGFDTPLRKWLRVDLVPQMRDLLARADSPLGEFLDVRGLLRHYNEFVETGRATLTEYQWLRLAGTSLWLEQLSSTPRVLEAQYAVP